MACVRAWITPRAPNDPPPTHDWKADAIASVARALAHWLAHVPETHHAAAMVGLQDGLFRDVARHARAALALAPAFPDALLLLGQLKIEAGDAKAGLEHVEAALDIDPSLHVGHYERARYHGLYGDPTLFEELSERLSRLLNERVLWGQLEVRVGAWRKEPDRVRRGLDALVRSPHPIAAPISLYARRASRHPSLRRVRDRGRAVLGEPTRAIDRAADASRSARGDRTTRGVRRVRIDRRDDRARRSRLDGSLSVARERAHPREVPQSGVAPVALRCEDIWGG